MALQLGHLHRYAFKEYRIVEEVIRYANTPSRLSDTALICTLDICRAAALVPPEGELPLRLIGNEIAHEIKVSESQGKRPSF
jgi:hypothetical protein